MVTIVYAKCDRSQRLDLWDNIISIANGVSEPWIIGGDFNLVLYASDKIGGLLDTLDENEDFWDCIEITKLT